MKLYALMVVRNEAKRMLFNAVANAKAWADGVLVYDDISSDDSVNVALGGGAMVVQRSPKDPSFMEHEGRFRTNALRAFDGVLEEGDWVFVLDADETLEHRQQSVGHVRPVLNNLIVAADMRSALGVDFEIVTVWDAVEKQPAPGAVGVFLTEPRVRRDSTPEYTWVMAEPRLWRYRKGVGFQDLPMACRNAPADVYSNKLYPNHPLALMHWGLSNPIWRREHWARYVAHPSGHNPQWVDSYLDKDPPLVAWSRPETLAFVTVKPK